MHFFSEAASARDSTGNYNSLGQILVIGAKDLKRSGNFAIPALNWNNIDDWVSKMRKANPNIKITIIK